MKKRAVFLSTVILLTSLFLNGCMIPFLGNEPVIIVTNPKTTAMVGAPYIYQVDTDDDGKTKLVFNLIVAPEGMTIEGSTGLIIWTPTEDQVGEHEVDIMVNDGWYKDNQEFTITVSKMQLSSISVLPLTMNFQSISSSKNIMSITAHYTDGSSAEINKAECVFQSKDTSVATVNEEGVVTSKKKGNTTITVSYTEEGITKSANIIVTVEIPTYTPPSSGG